MMTEISYSGFASLPRLSNKAIWLYVRFLSFRDVEDLLAKRGIAVSYETPNRSRLV